MSFDSDLVCVDNPCAASGQIECLSYEVINIDTTDSPYTASNVVVVLATADTGAITINLTADTDCPNATYIIKCVAGSTFNVNIVPPGGETINLGPSLTLTNTDEVVQLTRNVDNAPLPDWVIVSSTTSSQLTAKGDLLSYNGTSNEILNVGSNGQVLIADSAEPSGLKWITSAAVTAKIAYHIVTLSVDVTPIAWTKLAHFAWDHSRYSTYSSGVLIFWSEAAAGRTFHVRITDRTEATQYAYMQVTTSGIQNLSLTSLPAADERLIMSVRRDAGLTADPVLISCQLEFVI